MAEQHGAMRTLFESGTTRSIEWRTTQLNALLRLLEEDGKSLYPAMLSDLGKTESEAYLTEVAIVKRFGFPLFINPSSMEPSYCGRSIGHLFSSRIISRSSN
jgi:hypothetical protein